MESYRLFVDIFDVTQEADVGVALYSRKVLIQSKANQLLPRWLRFVKGIIFISNVNNKSPIHSFRCRR